jgi:formate transporter
MYFIPKAILLLQQQNPEILILTKQSNLNYSSISWSNFLFNNLAPVTLGNIVGGAVLVGMVYWFVYLRNNKV